MNYSDIQHRFANKLEGKNGRIAAGNVRYEGRNYYSYSSVFGQWVDISKNVVVIFDGSTSISSSKHKLWKGVFPDDVHVFPLDFGSSSYYGWRNCNLVSYISKDEDFKEYHRMKMIDHYVERIYNQIAAIKDGKKKGLENVSFKAWNYIEELCSLYKDTSIAKYLKWGTPKKDMNKTQKELINRQRKLVKLLKDGERNVQVLTDALFGEGTFKKYWDYCARYRKAKDKKLQMIGLFHRLGMASPYGYEYRGDNYVSRDYTPNDVRKMTAKERNDLHFENLAIIENRKGDKERSEKYKKNRENAYRWIMGCEPPYKTTWNGTKAYDDSVYECHNMFTGEKYVIDKEHISGFYWADTKIDFNYEKFRASEDKEQWIREFYAKVKEVQDNRFAIEILKHVKAHTKEKAHSWDDDVYINDDYLRENTTDSEYNLCAEFIRKQDKHYADEEARRRAAEIARLKREEEERKEKEYMEQVKQEQIVECLKDGVEGCRNLWRKHLTDLYKAECSFDDAASVFGGDMYYGGNVLLRLSFHKTHVETSKHVRIAIPVCKKMWPIVKAWHENPSCFKAMEIDTKGSGRYTISSYQNDILTAGCHKIAYTEMERMYNEIIAAV